MPHYVHKFEVEMVVEDVRNARVAKSWIEHRLDGGDAGFSVKHTGPIIKLTLAQEERLRDTGAW